MEAILGNLAFWALVIGVLDLLLLIIFWQALKKSLQKIHTKLHDFKERFKLFKDSQATVDEKLTVSLSQSSADTIKKLEKENQYLKSEIQALKEQFQKFSSSQNSNPSKTKEELKVGYSKPDESTIIQEYAFTPFEQKFKIEKLKKEFDPDTCFFVIEYSKDKNYAEFYIHPECNFKKLIKYWDQYCHVVEEVNKNKNFTQRIQNLEKGELKKENNYWTVSKKLKIQYE